MQQDRLFEQALELGKGQWEVEKSRFEGEPKTLEIFIQRQAGSQWACPECGKSGPLHDSVEKRWRHLNFFQYRCEIIAQIPRVNCAECGVRMVGVPWAREGSGFTLLFESAILLLSKDMPISAIAQAVGEEDTRLWRLIRQLVEAAHARSDWSQVKAIAIDETSSRKGKRYVTVILDAETRGLLFLAEGRSSQAVHQFQEALLVRNGQPGQIQYVVMDMLHCYRRGVLDCFPQARIVYDRYHVMVMAGEAIDQTRKALQRAGANLKGGLWSLRGNQESLSVEQRETRQHLAREYKEIGRALTLREALQDAYRNGGEEQLRWWCRWAKRSRLEAFAKLAKTLETYWDGVTAFFSCRLTQGAIEAINGIIQLAKRRARGFRNFLYLRTIAYRVTGKLDFNLPSSLAT